MIDLPVDLVFSDFLSDATKSFLTGFFMRLSSVRTRNNYCLAVNEFCEFIKKDLTSATRDDCFRYIEHLENKKNCGLIKLSTVNKKRFQLSSVFNAMNTPNYRELLFLNDGFCNFFADVHTTPVSDSFKLHKIPSMKELDALYQYLALHDPMICAAFLLTFKGFLKTDEFRKLTLADFFTDGSGKMVVRIRNSSHASDVRYNSISEDMRDFFCTYFQKFDNCFLPEHEIYLFGKTDNTLYTDRSLCKRLKDACENAMIASYTFNDLRNAGAVYAASYHVDVTLIANSMGYRTTKHINRLSSLKLTINDAADYMGVSFKNTVPVAPSI